MKTQINNENRRRFEALYFGQDVFWTCREPMEKDNILDGRKLARPFSKYDAIELKPLSSISDEDSEFIDLRSEDYNEDGWYDKEGMFYWWAFSDVDYLRSKGYALPWMGLSVEEMIEAGWIN